MKKFIVGVSLLVAFSGSATAADLPNRIYAPIFTSPIFSWTGFYVGLHAGYGVTEARRKGTVLAAPMNVSKSLDGFIGGVHAGYNYQTGSIVLGVEADLDYAGAKGSTTALGVTSTDSFKLKGSVRGRVGYAFDRVLFYGTGGIALASTSINTTYLATSAKNDHVRIGWTIGAGAAYAFTDALSARLEYRYTNLGAKSQTFGAAPLSSIVESTRLREQAILAGVSYRF